MVALPDFTRGFAATSIAGGPLTLSDAPVSAQPAAWEPETRPHDSWTADTLARPHARRIARPNTLGQTAIADSSRH
ncbi:MAG: hypothetical protein ACFB2Z_14975 [Maricaulaceae bacterium]